LGTVATGVLGPPLDKLVVLAVMTSSLAATQLAILGAARTSLSMAHAQAMPRSLRKVHPRFLTPHVSTIVVGVLAAIWYAPLNLIAQDFLSDTLAGLSLMVAFHYALAGFACVIYYRRELLKSVKNFVFIGAAPLVGAALLTCIFVESLIALADPSQSRIGGSLFGLGLPLVVGLGFLVLGAILMVFWRFSGHERFFGRRALEGVDPEVAAGRVAAPTNTGTTRSR
jgi:amino acid transporter